MHIKHVKNDPQSMSHDGGKILKSLQNESLPLIDIIVREAIQNSLDASLHTKRLTNVSFDISSFQSELLAPYFEEIDEILLNRYPGRQTHLAIRDENTTGLTGAFKITDNSDLDHSNFHKLVFSIGKNQDKDGAGGSWGYGKTSYFRLGVGLIIYYTRIKTAEGYEDRLIASMIEDPKKKERLLMNNERGIAWWGDLARDEYDSIYPLTDSERIHNFLDVFSIERYKGDETGTTIIIPYLPEKETESIDESVKVYPWEYTYEDEINIAIQRWYFPRILNENYSKRNKNPMLLAKVNGIPIDSNSGLEPVFKIYQEIYNTALSGIQTNKDIQVADIKFRATNQSGEIIGRVAFKEVSKHEMEMLPPNNRHSALAYLGEKSNVINERFNSSVMAYSRRPGMIIEYSIDGRWIPAGINIKDNHILLAFFVPNSFVELSNEFKAQGYNDLEKYLRSIETSDHATWDDKVGVTIVKRIKSYSSLNIGNIYKEADGENDTYQTSALSRRLGKIFMPPKSFGKSATSNPRQQKNTRKIKSVSRSDLMVENTNLINDKKVSVEIKVILKANSESEVYMFVNTQERSMDLESWNKTFDGALEFPFVIGDIHRLDCLKNKIRVNEDLNTEKVFISRTNDSSKFIIQNYKNEVEELYLQFVCEIKQGDLAPSVGIKTVKEDISDE